MVLFRPEVSQRNAVSLLGELRTTHSVPAWVITAIAVLLAIALVSYGILGTYAKKSRVNGILVSQGGELNVTAPSFGRIVELRIKEGQAVRTGETLMILNIDRPTEFANGTKETAALISEQIENKRIAFASQRQSKESFARLQKQTIEFRLRSQGIELENIEDEIALQKRRRDLAATSVQRYEKLVLNKFVSAIQVQQQQEILIDQDSKLKSLERTLTGIKKEQAASAIALRQADIQLASELAVMDQELASLNQESTENAAKRSSAITATRPGTVSAIAVTLGQTVSSGQNLVAIQPESSKLEAHLYIPTHTVGFIKEGQHVLVRYAAFPYQKFGLYQGKLSTVSQSAFAPNDLPPSLQTLFGRQNTPESLYRVTVSLNDQEIVAFGQRHPLRPGMALEADIVQEKRTIIEWLFEPLFAFSQRA
ncbi:secretion protein [Sulfurimicrobium lacus]|uniref:Secretion protein n=1 Tax=Sulfurimicrobium lacus TaxID=2715678 RepID=A0A6F8VFC4_9PROT|nr:HlyD family efflux transporter periplasmic adaptor subunit [Sulfurimicrobium lacus]BCB27652.1 secretion protein [Sulfurimicrobium lacus]